jgi:ABC-type uncharacterized transport system substrate-binding protein
MLLIGVVILARTLTLAPLAAEAQQATTTIPIVTTGVGDAVGQASPPTSRGRVGTSPD